MLAARPAVGVGGPVVNFYNGSGESGAEIMAETADQASRSSSPAGSARFS